MVLKLNLYSSLSRSFYQLFFLQSLPTTTFFHICSIHFFGFKNSFPSRIPFLPPTNSTSSSALLSIVFVSPYFSKPTFQKPLFSQSASVGHVSDPYKSTLHTTSSRSDLDSCCNRSSLLLQIQYRCIKLIHHHFFFFFCPKRLWYDILGIISLSEPPLFNRNWLMFFTFCCCMPGTLPLLSSSLEKRQETPIFSFGAHRWLDLYRQLFTKYS